MKYLIAVSSLIFALILGAGISYCAYQAIVDNDITWAFVMLGLILPAAVCLIITQAAFAAVKDY